MVPGGIESLALLAVSLFFFVAIGIRQSSLTTPDSEFWFAGSAFTERQLAATWSAGTLSLGLTILYYMAMTSVFGWKIFLISILTYFIGQMLFRDVATKWRRSRPADEVTVDTLVSAGTERLIIIRLAQYSGLFSLMAMLYAELHFSSLLINSLLANSGRAAPTMLFVLSVIVVALYVLFGGMRATVESDRWQLLLLYGAIMTLVVLAGVLLATGTTPRFSSPLPWFSTSITQVDTLSYFGFGLAANILPLLCQNSLWQMASSTKADNVASGSILGIQRTFVIFVIVILVAFVINGKGQPVSPDVLVQSMIALGQFGSHLLLPLMFVGLLAAMLSTADNLLLSSALTVRNLLNGSSLGVWHKLQPIRQRILLIGGLGALQVVAYVLVTHVLRQEFSNYFLSLVFFLFSQAAPFGVIVLLSVLAPHRLRRSWVLPAGVILGWLLDFSAFVVATGTGLQKLQFFATPVAILITFLMSWRWRTPQEKIEIQP
jgi:Na+/proline symporter